MHFCVRKTRNPKSEIRMSKCPKLGFRHDSLAFRSLSHSTYGYSHLFRISDFGFSELARVILPRGLTTVLLAELVHELTETLHACDWHGVVDRCADTTDRTVSAK